MLRDPKSSWSWAVRGSSKFNNENPVIALRRITAARVEAQLGIIVPRRACPPVVIVGAIGNRLHPLGFAIGLNGHRTSM